MTTFDLNRQNALIRALINHPDNVMHSPHFAMGYMTGMMNKLFRKLPPEQRELFLSDVDYIIDRHKRQEHDQKVAG